MASDSCSFRIFSNLGFPLGYQNEVKIPSHPSPTPALWSLGQPWAATATRLGYIGTIWEQFRLVWILFWSYFAKALWWIFVWLFILKLQLVAIDCCCIGLKNVALGCTRASSSSHAWAWPVVVVARKDFLETYVLQLPQSCGLEWCCGSFPSQWPLVMPNISWKSWCSLSEETLIAFYDSAHYFESWWRQIHYWDSETGKVPRLAKSGGGWEGAAPPTRIKTAL